SVLASGIAGWVLMAAIVLAMPDLEAAARQGPHVFFWVLEETMPAPLRLALLGGITLAQYLCGLATVTSASRMAYAFARDGGLPFSSWVRWVSPRYRTPPVAIWGVGVAAVLFTVWAPVYATITAVCTILLYLSYVLPTALGLIAYG